MGNGSRKSEPGGGQSQAYRFGLKVRQRFGGQSWQEVEKELERQWSRWSGLTWEAVRDEVRAGWNDAGSRGAGPSKEEGITRGSSASGRRYDSSGKKIMGGGGSGSTGSSASAYGTGCSSPESVSSGDFKAGFPTEGENWGEGGSHPAFGNDVVSPADLAYTVRPPDVRSPASAAQPPAPKPALPASPPPAYALLRCPEVVVAEVEFELTVGLSPEKMSSSDEPLDIPQSPEVRMMVHVVADGFRLRAGESERNELTVTREQPYPKIVLHLTPVGQDVPVRARVLHASYSIDGQTIGVAMRPVAVVESEETAEWALPDQEEAPRPGTIRVPTAGTAPDLTISIYKGDSTGDLLWGLDSPHPVELSGQRLKSSIGSEPEHFARQLVDKVNVREGKSGLYTFLLGHGKRIATKVPTRVWQVLREVAAKKRSGEPLSVLILSAEPYVPWELAAMPEPLLDPAAPPFLAAQAAVGRWVMPSDSGDRPKLPPPTDLGVKTMAVVSGVYDDPDFRPLEEAVQETADLERLYDASKVDAKFDAVSDCLQGEPGAEVLHFAVHGIYDPKGIQNGLVLTDKRTLDPADVEGVDLTRGPFVFLNACQVGSSHEVLGDYSGLASAFLFAGASGVIAPLWSVKDEVAREIALGFYRQVAEGRPPAAILRGERARFDEDASTATYLAYQFFGHPQLKLAGLRSHEGVDR